MGLFKILADTVPILADIANGIAGYSARPAPEPTPVSEPPMDQTESEATDNIDAIKAELVKARRQDIESRQNRNVLRLFRQRFNDGRTLLNAILATNNTELIAYTLIILKDSKIDLSKLTEDSRLVSHNSSLKYILSKKNVSGESPLHLVLNTENIGIINQYFDLLLDEEIFPEGCPELQAIVSARDLSGKSTLYKVVALENHELVEKFVSVLKNAGESKTLEISNSNPGANRDAKNQYLAHLRSEVEKLKGTPDDNIKSRNEENLSISGNIAHHELYYLNNCSTSAFALAEGKPKILEILNQASTEISAKYNFNHGPSKSSEDRASIDINTGNASKVACVVASLFIIFIAILIADLEADLGMFFENSGVDDGTDKTSNLFTSGYDSLNTAETSLEPAEELMTSNTLTLS